MYLRLYHHLCLLRKSQALHRRKGPRSHSVLLPADYAKDWNGREVKADWSALRTARIVVIEVEDGDKHYRAAGP